MSMANSSDLIFSPRDTLTIRVSESEPAETALKISNPTSEHIAFKVKTTSPERYLVKPNHGLIRYGRQSEVTIIIVHTKKKDILTEALTSPANCRDKFLVQSLGIDAILADELESKTSLELADAITQLFVKKDKFKLQAKKLPVELLLDDPPRKDGSGVEKGHISVGKSPELTNSRLMPGTPEAMFAEIVALRKKYDDLVAFTVNLTAERDSISLDLPNSHTCPEGVPQDKTASFGGSSLNAERRGMDSDMPPASSMTSVISISLISCLFGWCSSQLVRQCGS